MIARDSFRWIAIDVGRIAVGLGLLWAPLGSGCDDPDPRADRPGFDATGKDAADPAAPRYGVIASDYTASAVSLLNAAGDVVADDYIDSAAEPAGLTTALSGDVVLPTRSGERGVLVLIDRFKTDVITRIDLASGDVLGQVRTETPAEADEAAYSSNPQDYLRNGDDAWVSRSEPNLDPAAPELEHGGDLLRIDPEAFERSDRIDLASLDSRSEDGVTVYARPSRFVRLGDTLVVGLLRMSFDYTLAGDGAVALVDLRTRKVRSFALPGLQSCGDVVPVAGADDRVIVSCTGHFGGDVRGGSGLVLLSIAAGEAEIVAQWRGSDHDDAPLMVANPVSVGGHRVAAVAFGQRAVAASDLGPAQESTPDRYGLVDLEGGEQEALFEAEGSSVIGSGSYDAKGQRLLVPDASVDADMRPTSGVRRFQLGEDSIEELDVVPVVADLALPVRQIAPL
jgi:hypothetical protein